MSTTELTPNEVKAAARAQGKCDSCQWNSATNTCILTGGCRHSLAIHQAASYFTVIHAGTPIERALATQIGGSHYKDMPIQPAEYCHKNGIGKLEGDVIAYVSRWRKKNGIEDLKKARHTLDIIIELEAGDAPAP